MISQLSMELARLTGIVARAPHWLRIAFTQYAARQEDCHHDSRGGVCSPLPVAGQTTYLGRSAAQRGTHAVWGQHKAAPEDAA